MNFRLPLFGILVLGILLNTTACNSGYAALEGRVLSFLRVANDFSASREYFTPLMRDALSDVGSDVGGLAIPGAVPKITQLGSEVLSKIGPDDIAIRGRGNWARVTISVPTEYGKEPVETIWLRIGSIWYLYSGTSGEKNKYGEPPYFAD